jgi:hypothetical protein
VVFDGDPAQLTAAVAAGVFHSTPAVATRPSVNGSPDLLPLAVTGDRNS